MSVDQPVPGGGLSEFLASADQLLDTWIAHTAMQNSSTPEIIAGLYFTRNTETTKHWEGFMVGLLATAIRRLAPTDAP